MNFINLAYSKEEHSLDQFRECHVLDLFRTSVKELNIENFPNLKRLRASRSHLRSVVIKDCPNLEVIDVSYNSSLNSINLQNVPKLRSLNLRSTNIFSLDYSLPSLEYLDISNTKINDILPDSPNLLAFDNSGCVFNNFDLLPIANKYPKLQRLRSLTYVDRIFSNSYGIHHRIQLDLNKISEHPSLEHILCGPASVTCDSISQNTHLTTICLEYPEFIQGTKEQLLSTFHAVVIDSVNTYNTYTVSKYPDYHPMEWEKAAILLFGPWGIPEPDLKPHITPPASFDKQDSLLLKNLQPSNMTIAEVSEKYDLKIAVDHMMGAIFGSALGDSLGMATEFTNTKYAHFALDIPLSFVWNTLPEWDHSDIFYQGTVTDDTEQAVMIMRTLADCNGELNLSHFAQLMRIWAQNGIREHAQSHAFDVGGTTGAAVYGGNYIKDPLSTALRNTYRSRGNGSAMRTAPVGCYKFWDLNTVTKYALNFGCTTHYNDVCAVCTIVCSVLIAKNIQRYSDKSTSNPQRMTSEEIDDVIDNAFNIVSEELSSEFNVQSNKEEIMKYLKASDFETLELSGRQTGYVLRATGAAVLALRKGMNFEEAMTEVIRWAGDADSNGAVVGGIIGAVVGFSNISPDLLKYLFTANWKYVEFERMCKVMNIEVPPSPFLNLSYQ